MLRASRRGEYDGLTTSRAGLMALAAVYVVSPIDLVPEGLLLLLGLADDAVVVAWLAGALLDETERFIAWEKARQNVINGQVLH